MPGIDYLPNGKIICFDHRARICAICCFDFTSDGTDSDDSYENEYEGTKKEVTHGKDDEVMEEGGEDEDHKKDDQVSVLGTSVNRFLPQIDSQLVDHNLQIPIDYDNPPRPDPISTLNLRYCSRCELAWLQNKVDSHPRFSHPSHFSCFHTCAGKSRSMIVFIDGACSNNGSESAKGGYGVFFGINSQYNISQPLLMPPGQCATSQKAELGALVAALEVVRKRVVPTRRAMIENAFHGASRSDIADITQLRLVVTSDSSYLVEGMCRNIGNWKLDRRTNIYYNRGGKAIANSEAFLKAQNEVTRLAEFGVQVVFYHISREDNVDADRLAVEGISAQSITTYSAGPGKHQQGELGAKTGKKYSCNFVDPASNTMS